MDCTINGSCQRQSWFVASLRPVSLWYRCTQKTLSDSRVVNHPQALSIKTNRLQLPWIHLPKAHACPRRLRNSSYSIKISQFAHSSSRENTFWHAIQSSISKFRVNRFKMCKLVFCDVTHHMCNRLTFVVSSISPSLRSYACFRGIESTTFSVQRLQMTFALLKY